MKLYRIDIAGGPPRILCDAARGGKGGTWSEEDVIVFGRSRGPLHRADASGEGCEPLTVLDPAFPDEIESPPAALPSGRPTVPVSGEPGGGGRPATVIAS